MFAAHAASSLVASQVALPSSVVPPRPAPIAAPARPRHEVGTLAARNMFCASCAPATGLGVDFALPPAVLIATSLGDEPRATVHVLGNDVQGSWGLGEAIPGLGRVDQIASRWIAITTAGGQVGRLQLLDLTTAAAGPDSAKLPGPAAAGSPFGDRLRELDESTYEVDRALIRELFAGGSSAVTGRLVPAMRDGQPVGIKVFGVRPGTIPYLLKLQNGDQIEAINGASLTSANAMLALYASLDQLNVAEVTISRRGKPITRSLRLR
ncbi:MAG TPA: hypothetical protein VGC42_26395 [Kofleriaceae bacterium]